MLQRISIIYLPLEPKLEIIRNIFRSGFDLSLGQTENISGRGKLQMDRKCQNLHTVVLSLHIPRGPLNPLTKHGRNASHLGWILIAWSPNLCKPLVQSNVEGRRAKFLSSEGEEGNTDSLNLTCPTWVSLKSVSQGKKVQKWGPQPQNATEQFPRL